eukprot:CAMPEP_0183334822 /NCGR_PEP_ID=MMETSP0164_2-20130417/3310_1 /TAXON_ID=221442 /ORGANISM="Coccolithus pelagicus ssp braarudi, Strain PLY182g" /LENGTH=159 /DNA_ID=CAMNT_0025504045 /DNA_START=23 /DNA_END=505 /DNA_ORIENTATION=-
MPFNGDASGAADEATCSQPIAFVHGEPHSMQVIISALCEKDMTKRLGCRGGGLREVQEHAFFANLDWGDLESGLLQAPFIPNPNDINAPSTKEVADHRESTAQLEAGAGEGEHFAEWEFLSESLLHKELCARIDKLRELEVPGRLSGKVIDDGCNCTVA